MMSNPHATFETDAGANALTSRAISILTESRMSLAAENEKDRLSGYHRPAFRVRVHPSGQALRKVRRAFQTY